MSPTSKCRAHGGGSLAHPNKSGPDHWNWKGGRYSRDVLVAGSKLGKVFLEHMRDPDHDSLAAEQALLRSHISQLISRGGNLSEADWSKIKHSIDVLGRITRTELKRVELSDDYIAAKEVAALLSAVQQSVIDEVPDVEVRRRIAARMRLILMVGAERSSAGRKLLSERTPAADAEYEVIDDVPSTTSPGT